MNVRQDFKPLAIAFHYNYLKQMKLFVFMYNLASIVSFSSVIDIFRGHLQNFLSGDLKPWCEVTTG